MRRRFSAVFAQPGKIDKEVRSTPMRTYFQAYIVVLHKVFPRAGCMQPRKTVQGKIVEKKIVCRTDEQIKLVQKLVKENCSSVGGLRDKGLSLKVEVKVHMQAFQILQFSIIQTMKKAMLRFIQRKNQN